MTSPRIAGVIPPQGAKNVFRQILIKLSNKFSWGRRPPGMPSWVQTPGGGEMPPHPAPVHASVFQNLTCYFARVLRGYFASHENFCPFLGGGSFGGAPPWMAREESPSSSIRFLVVLEKTARELGFGDTCENNLGYTPTPFSLEKAVFLLS